MIGYSLKKTPLKESSFKPLNRWDGVLRLAIIYRVSFSPIPLPPTQTCFHLMVTVTLLTISYYKRITRTTTLIMTPFLSLFTLLSHYIPFFKFLAVVLKYGNISNHYISYIFPHKIISSPPTRISCCRLTYHF